MVSIRLNFQPRSMLIWFTFEGKQEKDPNESLNKSQEGEKPEGGEKGGLFKRVSFRSSAVSMF